MKLKLIALAAVIVASGCIQTPSVPENPVDNASEDTELTGNAIETNTVYLTSDGFTPDTISVDQGDTVTWVNNASTPMWVATDEHPTHTNYAGSSLREHCQNGDQNSAAFDQCSSGDSFSFTFEQRGDWDYHNHERAGQTGTVVVE